MLSVLEDLIPAKYRKYVVYILIPLFVLIYGVYQSVQGDWTAFWPALVPAIIGWLVAAPNTHVPSLGSSSNEVPVFDTTDDPPLDVSQDQPDPQTATTPVSDEAAAAAVANAVTPPTTAPANLPDTPLGA